MALIRCNHFSRALGMAMHMHVILPEHADARRDLPVLWLLHGLSDDDSIWCRRTAIERYAEQYHVAVIMPNAHRSFYTNMVNGYDFWTYFSEELPGICQRLFPISRKREDTFVAGLSMGGYGALKLGLRQWERFSHIAALSPVTDLELRMKNSNANASVLRDMHLVHGNEGRLLQVGNNLFELSSKLIYRRKGKPFPHIYLACGTEDSLHSHAISYRDHALKCGFEVHFEDGPGGHSWAYWDHHIAKVLAWLPLTK
jgi:putative tributyrin esterase